MDLSNYCKVWHRQKVERKDGRLLKIRYQELPQARLEEAFDFNIEYMLREEPCHKAAGIYKNVEALEEYRLMLATLFMMGPPHVTICCVDDDSDYGGKMLGMSTMMLLDRSESAHNFAKQVTTKEMKAFFEMSVITEEITDINKKFSCHYQGVGIIVHPEYRGLGIGTEFIRLRTSICKEHKVPMTFGWMTVIGTQKAAQKNNYKVYVELDPEYVTKRCDVKFDDNTAVYKLMYTTIDIKKSNFKFPYKRHRKT